MLMNAAVGSAKNITPNREKAASNEAGSNGNTWASAWTNRTRLHPLAARCANASTAADRSTPTTVPSGATARARSSAVSPPPQPMSRTLSPGCGASAAKARQPSGASCSSNGSRTSAHAPTRTSSWVSIGRGLLWFMRRSLPDGRGMSRSLHGLKVGCWRRSLLARLCPSEPGLSTTGTRPRPDIPPHLDRSSTAERTCSWRALDRLVVTLKRHDHPCRDAAASAPMMRECSMPTRRPRCPG